MKLHKLYKHKGNVSVHFTYEIVDGRLNVIFYNGDKWEFVKDAHSHPSAWPDEDIIGWADITNDSKKRFITTLFGRE